jgi:hypothetical protein
MNIGRNTARAPIFGINRTDRLVYSSSASFHVLVVEREAECVAPPALISSKRPLATSARSAAAHGQFDLRIDTILLKDSFFRILGVTPDIACAGAVQTHRFSPGFYAFQIVAAQFSGFVFRVKPDGTLDYDPSCDGFLNGRGTRTLTILGMNISSEKSQQATLRAKSPI